MSEKSILKCAAVVQPKSPAIYTPEVELAEIVGGSSWTQDIRAKILNVAACPSNVLITGPTGTGKEIIARAIHAHSPRPTSRLFPWTARPSQERCLPATCLGTSRGRSLAPGTQRWAPLRGPRRHHLSG